MNTAQPGAPEGMYDDPLAVAVVGMAIRLPGADTLAGYWQNLVEGADTITRRGAREGDFVGAYGMVAGAGRFDARRFGISDAEALLIDPQQRLLLETADEALATANLDPAVVSRVAVYAGVGRNGYADWVGTALRGRAGVDDMALEITNGRDYAATRIAYRLGLGGAAVTVQSACSTALVAVHLACQDLIGHGCDAAVAATSAVQVPNPGGYLAPAGGIGSPAGRCVPFDVVATGTVPGDGTGAVVLKRLADAVADGDEVWAVIRGSAVNNDGADKSGFAGVNPRAQAAVVRDALRTAGVEPATVGYVEAHGSGTRLGDAAEWSALADVFGANPAPVHVGAVKANVGHLREAAGIAGLVKAVLCLRNAMLVPIPAHTALPADLARAGAVLRPVTATQPWATTPGVPRRAGVSSFGMGGTNAHLVLEESAPARPGRAGRPNLILLSSHLPETLDDDTNAHQAAAAADPDRLGDLAHTSRTAARRHRFRRFVLVSDDTDPAAAFAEGVVRRQTGEAGTAEPEVGFVLPGVGSHYLGMGVGLAQRLPLFAEHLAAVVRIADEVADGTIGPQFATAATRVDGAVDLAVMLRGRSASARAEGTRDLRSVHLGLFCFEHALASTLVSLGIRPAVLLGHSLGEWVSAVLAGVIDLPDAVAAVARRATLVHLAGPGAMLAVAAPAEEVERFAREGVWLAADNGPEHAVFSGRPAAVDRLSGELRAAGFSVLPVDASHPFHTPQLAEAADLLGDDLVGVPMRSPTIPVASSVLGGWLDDRVSEPRYWRDHMVSPVRFRAAAALAVSRVRVLVEVGPGTARPWLRQADPDVVCVPLVRQSSAVGSDLDVLLHGLGTLWLHGVEADWAALGPAGTRRVTRPRPALARERYLPDEPPPSPPGARALTEAVPAATRVAPRRPEPEPEPDGDGVAGHLRNQWLALLGLRDVHPEDHFFHLGGDSLLGVHLIAGLQRLTGRTVPSEVVFASARFAGMVGAVERWLADDLPPARPRSTDAAATRTEGANVS